MTKSLSIILPAKNEGKTLASLLPLIRKIYPEAEVIVADDGSTDDTADIVARSGAIRIHHPYSIGNGAAIKSGARAATGKALVFMDADGQHRPEDIANLLEKLAQGYDMAVGARTSDSQASLFRGLANSIYNRFASIITGHKIKDLTSGFRAVSAEKFREFLYLLPNGFSYPTTITMAFFRAGYSIDYVPIEARRRDGKSHIRPLHDGIRFLIIIFKVGTLYSPLKIFFPASLGFFFLGIVYYLYTFLMKHQFTNMGALLFSVSLIIFLIGLVSEQITALLYKDRG